LHLKHGIHNLRQEEHHDSVTMARERLADIDRAKGLGILLVVLGHLIADEYPPHNLWYFHLERIIYSFHMAFFMFLTGVVMFYSYPEMRTFGDYAAYVKKKFIRLIPAYCLFALIVAAGKMVAGRFAPIENSPGGLDGFLRVFLRPTDSYCRSVWYIYAIFIFFVTIPILLKIFQGNLKILLVIACGLYFVPRSPYFAQDAVCKHMFVFLLGGLAVQHYAGYVRMIDKYRWVFMAAFALCIAAYFMVRVPRLLFALCSIPALHALVRTDLGARQRVLDVLAKYTFPIYLMNTIAIGCVRVLVQKYWSWDGVHFVAVAPLLVVSGLLVPVLIHKIFIQNTRGLRTIIQA
jgi:fucose 4-O-acetylase-like acetyltransferase